MILLIASFGRQVLSALRPRYFPNLNRTTLNCIDLAVPRTKQLFMAAQGYARFRGQCACVLYRPEVHVWFCQQNIACCLSTTQEDVNFQPVRTSVILGDKCNDEWIHRIM